MSGPVPAFVTVTRCAALVVPFAWFSKDKESGARPTAGAVPTPLSDTVCEGMLPPKLSVSVPVRFPPAVGVNTTLTSHLLPPGTPAPQSLVSEKSPVTETDGVIWASPKLPTCTSAAALATPMFSAVRVTDSGTTPGTGAPKLGAIFTNC